MSKSLKRVTRALQDLNVRAEILQTAQSRTAQQAADAVNCTIDQIVKSIILQSQEGLDLSLFLTAGGNQVDMDLASGLAKTQVTRADAGRVRAHTGFAIGGVSPVGHLNPVPCFLDPRILAFDDVWAAAGTPQHVFNIHPRTLVTITGASVAKFTAAG